MFVITLGPGNVDLSIPATITLAGAVAMKVMDGSDAMILPGLLAALACGVAVGLRQFRPDRCCCGSRRSSPPSRRASSSSRSPSLTAAACRSSRRRCSPTPSACRWRACRWRPRVRSWPPPRIGVVLHPQDRVRPRGDRDRPKQARRPPRRHRRRPHSLPDLRPVRCLGGLNGALLAGFSAAPRSSMGNDYLLASIAVVVDRRHLGRRRLPTSRAVGSRPVPVPADHAQRLGAGAGIRLVVTGLIIIAVITAAAPGRKECSLGRRLPHPRLVEWHT